MKDPDEQPDRRAGLPDPFEGFFDDATRARPGPGGLLDLPAARRWFDVVGWGIRNDLYTYQQALECRSAPRVQVGGRSYLMASSYDYLGLIGHPAVDRAAIAAIERYGTGTGGVRLLTGTLELHRRLEAALAAFKRTEASMVFSSGYVANLAVISALFGPDDLVIADQRVHRSLIDGCRLAHVPVRTFAHNSVEDLLLQLEGPRPARTLVAIEGIYSMDGDIAPLPAIVALKGRHPFTLLVDEAHSLGVLGANGRGLDEHWAVPDGVDIWTGSLSKAIPACGGFVAARQDLIIYLQHGSGPFMFSAALAPAQAAAALAALRILDDEPWRLIRLRRNGERLREGLKALGLDIGETTTPLVPVVLGDDIEAYRAARELWKLGVLACAVVFPAVPRRQARLRICATAGHSAADIEEILSAFENLGPVSSADRADPVAHPDRQR